MSKDLKTLKKWNKLGFKVKRGSKSVARSKKGNPLFHKDQVEDRIGFHWSDDYVNILSDREKPFTTNNEDYSGADRFMPAQCIH